MINNTGNIYAYTGIPLRLSSANIDKTGLMLGARVKYTAVTSIASISTANSNMDGTGTLSDLITGASSGTLVKRIIIKAQGNTTAGMIRIFFKAGASSWLLREVPVEAITQSSTNGSFVAEINDSFFLKATYLLRVATQNAETFVVTAEGLEMTYPA